MQQKLEARAFEQVASLMQPGEVPVTATRATVGKFAAGRLGAVVKVGVAGAAAGAVGAVLASGGKQFVVLTNQRMIFLSQTFMGGPGKKVLGEMPRDQVSLAEVKMGLVSLLRIAFSTEGDGVSLTFPRVDRKNAEALAAALQPPAEA